MSYYTKKGVPYINDIPATRCEKGEGCISRAEDGGPGWICPVCHQHLFPGGVCLRGCHLPLDDPRRLFYGERDTPE